MNCPELKRRLYELADTEGAEGLPEEARAHLDRCPDCAALWRALGEESRTLRSLPRLSAPAGFLDEVRRKVEGPARAPGFLADVWAFLGSRRFLGAAGTLATAILVLVTLRAVTHDIDPKRPQSTLAMNLAESPKTPAPAGSPQSPGKPETKRDGISSPPGDQLTAEPRVRASLIAPEEGEEARDLRSAPATPAPEANARRPGGAGYPAASRASDATESKTATPPRTGALRAPPPADGTPRAETGRVQQAPPGEASAEARDAAKPDSAPESLQHAAGALTAPPAAPAPSPGRKTAKAKRGAGGASETTERVSGATPPVPPPSPGKDSIRERPEPLVLTLAVAEAPPAGTGAPSPSVKSSRPARAAPRAEAAAPAKRDAGARSDAEQSKPGFVESLIPRKMAPPAPQSAPEPHAEAQVGVERARVASRNPVDDVKDLVIRLDGGILATHPASGTDRVERLEIEIPSVRYNTFVERLRRMGELTAPGEKPAGTDADSTILRNLRVTVRFRFQP